MTRNDVIMMMTSSPISSSMPHLGLPDTIQQPLNHNIYRSSSVALTGCRGDDAEVAVTTRKTRTTNGRRQERCRRGAMTSRDSLATRDFPELVEQWNSRRRQSLSTGSNSR